MTYAENLEVSSFRTKMDRVFKNWFGINWQLSASSGWGLLALNIALEAEREGGYRAVPFAGAANSDWLPAEHRLILQSVLNRSGALPAFSREHSSRQFNFTVLHALGNRLSSHDAAERVVGKRNLGVLFFDDTVLGEGLQEIARRFDLLLAGSTWNSEVLLRHNVKNVRKWLQGLDLSIFKPVYQASETRRPFVIFSGGKIEFRKGQDIVVEAFRKFRKRRPEAILLTMWHNHWPDSAKGIDSKGYVEGFPLLNSEGYLDITPWLERNGIPSEASFNLRATPNYAMPAVYSQADVALFPNRCEGGTNLVAMECLASGLPTILSANTGHLDLIDEKHCYPLFRQGLVDPVAPLAQGTDEWGESDAEEILDALERVFCEPTEAERRGKAAACFMKDWSWRKRFIELSELMDELELA